MPASLESYPHQHYPSSSAPHMGHTGAPHINHPQNGGNNVYPNQYDSSLYPQKPISQVPPAKHAGTRYQITDL